jgi:hypothetical protein
MPTEPDPLTLSQLVHRAAAICDPDGADDDVAELLLRFEDADEPVEGIEDIEQRMAEATGALDPQAEQPALQMAGAVVVYLAHRRDETDDDPESILRLAARAEFDGSPPPPVADWLAEQGIEL